MKEPRTCSECKEEIPDTEPAYVWGKVPEGIYMPGKLLRLDQSFQYTHVRCWDTREEAS